MPRSRKRVDWEKLRDRLGTVPDQEIADETGYTRERVRQIRAKFGIASNRERHGHVAVVDALEQNAELVAVLGSTSDRELARRHGVAATDIRALRERFRVKAFKYRSPCGTASAYNRKCRCDACRAGHNARISARWRKRRDEAAVAAGLRRCACGRGWLKRGLSQCWYCARGVEVKNG